MKPSQMRDLLLKAIPGKRRLMFVGKPGVGKTHVVMQVCEILGYDLIVMCLPLDDPSTIRGYPRPPSTPDGVATHCLFDGMAKAFGATKPTYLFFDDAGQASESTLKSVMRVFQFGELDGRKLPDSVVLGAATNDVGHGAGVYGMIEPLKSRFHSIVNVETDIDEVCGYGLSRSWPAWLIAYLRNCPQALNDWKPSKSMSVDGACPRGWEYLAEWDNMGIDDSEVWSGCVGKGRATEARAFKELIGELPDLDACLLDPDGSPVPDNPSARFLIAASLASRLACGNFGNAVRYLNRLPAMFRAYCVRDAIAAENQKRRDQKLPKDYKPISSARDFTAFALSADGKAIMSAMS